MSGAGFSLGAEAVSRRRPDLPNGYACPICMLIFPQELSGGLTVDHVPPKSIGGRRMVLTCRTCNSVAGSDADAGARARNHRLPSSRSPKDRPSWACCSRPSAPWARSSASFD